MTYAVVGGDKRMQILAQLLAKEDTVLDCTEALYDLRDSECIVLPVPAEKNGELFAPNWPEKMSMERLVEQLPDTALICGGKFSADTKLLAEKRGLHLHDLMNSADFTVGNAALTAEGAVHLLMDALPRSVSGARVLVVGFGRIGKLLCRRLSGLGAFVTVMSENAESRAMAKALGYAAISPADAVGSLDAAVNTAPARVLKSLEKLSKSCLLLELASAPGGFDRAEAKRLGMRYIDAPGLPGAYAPESAAALIGEAVKNISKEQKA